MQKKTRRRTFSLRTLIARRRRDPVMLLPYLAYGTRTRATLMGRVLEDEGFRPAKEAERRWRNLLAFFKRLESDEVPDARVRARHGGQTREAVSDREGYFRLELGGRFAEGWSEVALELAGHPEARANARVLVPPAAAEFGVVSDIDDTVVQSHVTAKLRMLLTVAFSNARTRKPFAGVAAFYRALHRGVNPFFYVSKSPWNLYVPLLEYLEVQGLPAGPLALRDFGWRMEKAHKTRAIVEILETYPRLPFVLIGDAGERDPEIYAAIVRRFPRRIHAIYIRSVDPDPARVAAIEKLALEVARTDCQLVLSAEADLAAAHAAAEGLIAPDTLRAVRADLKRDRAALSLSR